MLNKRNARRAIENFRSITRNSPLLKASIVAFALVLWATPSGAQSPVQTTNEANRLPPTAGEPLTIKPVDMPDVDCVIAQWSPADPRPVLTVICPPETVFAPLRVLIKFSWLRPQATRPEAMRLPFRAGSLTKIRTNKDVAQIWLRLEGAPESWVSFDAVRDVALVLDRKSGGSARVADRKHH